MNAEENIIAFLNGDLTDESQAAMLMRELADSPEQRRLLVQHAQASRYLGSLGRKTAPSAAAIAAVLNVVAGYDSVGKGKEVRHGQTKTDLSPLRLVGFGLMLTVSFLLGVGTSLFYSGTEKKAQDMPPLTGSADSTIKQPSEFPTAERNPLSQSSSSNMHADNTRELDKSPLLNRPPFLTPPHQEVGPLQPATADTGLPSLLSFLRKIEVVTPSGGEEFAAGSLIPLVWSGALRNQPATLAVSSDAGASWEIIGRNVTGGRMLWTIPSNAVESTRYLLKVSTDDPNGSAPWLEDNFSLGTLPVDALNVSYDGKTLGLGTGPDLILWDIPSGKQTARITAHDHDIYYIDFSPDGTKIVTSSRDESVRIWDRKTLTLERIIRPNQSYMWLTRFSRDGKTLAMIGRSDSIITFWDVATGKLKDSITNIHKESLRFFEYTPDDKKILTASTDRTATILDAATGKVLLRVVHHPIDEHTRKAMVLSAQLTRDESILITCGYDGWVKFWDARTGELIRERSYHNGEPAYFIQLSKDGTFLTSIGQDGMAKLIDPYSGEVLAEMTINTGEKRSPMLHSMLGDRDNLLAIAHQDGQVSIWRLGFPTVTAVSDNFWTIRPCADASGVEEENNSPQKMDFR